MKAEFTINRIQIEKYFVYLDEMLRGGFKLWRLEDELKKKFKINRAKARCIFRRWNAATQQYESHKGRVDAVCRQLRGCDGWLDGEIDDDPGEGGEG